MAPLLFDVFAALRVFRAQGNIKIHKEYGIRDGNLALTLNIFTMYDAGARFDEFCEYYKYWLLAA